jgi:hypothetical protein
VRREIIVAGAAVHLIVAALFATHVRIERYLPSAIERPLRVYGGYTGASTHFDFFAPAVPTQPRVRFEITAANGGTRVIDFATPSAEVNQRFAVMYATYELPSLRSALVRAWAVFVLERYPDARSVEVQVDVLDVPTLAQAHRGKTAQWVEAARTVVRREDLQ